MPAEDQCVQAHVRAGEPAPILAPEVRIVSLKVIEDILSETVFQLQEDAVDVCSVLTCGSARLGGRKFVPVGFVVVAEDVEEIELIAELEGVI